MIKKLPDVLMVHTTKKSIRASKRILNQLNKTGTPFKTMTMKKPKPPLANAEPVPADTYPVSFECGNCGADWTHDVQIGRRVYYSYGDGGMVEENPNDDQDFSILPCPKCQVRKDVKKMFPYASGPATDTRDDLD